MPPQRRCKICQASYANERFCPIDGGAVIEDGPTDDPMVGRTIDGRYLVRAPLGRGGMGIVYEADHIGLDKRVAIKFLNHEGEDSDAVARFRREARAASKLAHEHVVQIFDVGSTSEGADFIVMEYVEGTDLRRALEDGPLEPTRAVAIARQILRGLHAIHQAGIIHRDVKPANVLLTKRGDVRDFVKLTDFGIAKSMRDTSEPLTGTGKVVGTPQFMAPEQFTEQDFDHRADLYSVGLTLFAMLAGDVPFRGRDAAGLAAMHLSDPPPSLDELRPGLPAPLVRAIARALEKSPRDRFPDALAFIAALDAIAPDMLTHSDTATGVIRPSVRDLAESATAVERAKSPAREPSGAATAVLRPSSSPSPPSRSGSTVQQESDAAPTAERTRESTTEERSDPRRDSDAVETQRTREARQDSAGDPIVASRRFRPWLMVGLAVLAIGGLAMFVRERYRELPAMGEISRDAPASSLRAAEQVASAQAAERRGDLELAIASYQAAYAADASAETLYRIAALEERLGRPAEAVRYFRRYLEAAPAAADRDSVFARIAKLEQPMIDAGVAALDARPASPRSAPRQRCVCLHEIRGNAGRFHTGFSLCKKKTTTLCRCMHRGSHLCSAPFVCDPADCNVAAKAAKQTTNTRRWCEDKDFSKFRVPAKSNDVCTGYLDDTTSVAGRYDCNVCPDVDAVSYFGKNDDRCTGFVRSTGEPASGFLTNCAND